MKFLHKEHGAIMLGEDTVAKTAEPGRMRVEVEKTRRAYRIGESSGLFRVPRVLEYDPERGRAVFERIRRLTPVRGMLGRDERTEKIMERAGRSLAAIHRHLELPADMLIPLPAAFVRTGNDVFLHGDFNGSNLAVEPGSSRVVILDWQMTSRHGGRATFGNAYFDLVWFVNYLIWTPTIRYLFGDPVTGPARLFVGAYLRESGIGGGEDLLDYAREFFRVKLPARKAQARRRSRILLPRSRVLTRRFLGFLEETAGPGN